MTSGPAVAVVIPAYNVASFLSATLDSVLAQTLTDWTCVVVDDGSSDDTLLIARDYARRDARIVALHQENRGAAAARNTGFRHSDAGARYVTFMDADDVWHPDALAVLTATAQGDADCIGAHGLAETIDASGAPQEPGWYSSRGRERRGVWQGRLTVLPLAAPTDFAVLINGNVLFPPGLVLARREVYLEVGGFDTAFNGPEDWDMLIRLSRHGHLAFVDRVLLDYRRHSHNLGARPGIARQAWLVRCKGYWSLENSAAQRRLARDGWRADQGDLARDALAVAAAAVRHAALRPAVIGAAKAVVAAVRSRRSGPRPRVTSAGRLPW